jgi:hypothetical protein
MRARTQTETERKKLTMVAPCAGRRRRLEQGKAARTETCRKTERKEAEHLWEHRNPKMAKMAFTPGRTKPPKSCYQRPDYRRRLLLLTSFVVPKTFVKIVGNVQRTSFEGLFKM